MSDEKKRLAAFDARLRGLIGGLDARAGFEERVMARVAALAAPADREDLCAQFERRRELLRRRLAREAWTSGITIAGIGVAATALVFEFASEIRHWMLAPDPSTGPDLLQVTGGAAAILLTVVLWPFLRKLPFIRDL